MKTLEIKTEGVKELKELSKQLDQKLSEVKELVKKINETELTFTTTSH